MVTAIPQKTHKGAALTDFMDVIKVSEVIKFPFGNFYASGIQCITVPYYTPDVRLKVSLWGVWVCIYVRIPMCIGCVCACVCYVGVREMHRMIFIVLILAMFNMKENCVVRKWSIAPGHCKPTRRWYIFGEFDRDVPLSDQFVSTREYSIIIITLFHLLHVSHSPIYLAVIWVQMIISKP